MGELRTFLGRLAQEAGKTLPPHEVEGLVAEAREHLEDSIQARLELGNSPRDAEREALRAFGAARAVVDEVRRREPRFDRPFAWAALAFVAWFAWATNQTSIALVWFGGYVLIHVALVATSLRARRPQLPTLAAFLLPLWLGTAASEAMRRVSYGTPYADGLSTMDRKDVAARSAEVMARAERTQSVPTEIVEGYARYLRGTSDLAPGRIGHFDADWRLRLKTVADRAAGVDHWRRAVRYGIRMAVSSGVEEFQTSQRMREAARRPWIAELPLQLGFAAQKTAVAEFALLYGGGHLFFWMIGSASSRRRARAEPTSRA